jgi:hypothetical protein
MGIADLFRPNWKHSKRSVRLAAVKDLDPTEVPTLLDIAETDPDPELRELALTRIEDAEALEAFAERVGDADADLANTARQRADELWMTAATQGEDPDAAESALARVSGEEALSDVVRRSPLEPIQRLALERMQDPRSLAEVVKHTRDQELASLALSQIEDCGILRGLVLEEPRREIAGLALDRIEDPESLKLVSHRAKVKAIRTRAKRKLEQQQAPDEEEQAAALADKKRHAQRVQLLRQMEEATRSTDWAEATGRLEALRREWEALSAEGKAPTTKLQERLDSLIKGFELRREQAVEVLAARAQRDEVAQEHRADREAREGLLQRILAVEGGEEDPEAALERLEAEWESLGPTPEPYRAEFAGRFDTACRQARRHKERAEERAEREAAFEALLAEAEETLSFDKLGAMRKAFDEHRRSWQRLEKRYGRDEALHGRFEALRVRLREHEADAKAARQQRQQENLERVQSLVSRAEEGTQLKSIPKLDRLLKDVRATLKKPGPLPDKAHWNELKPRLQQARDALVIHLRELREQEDWKRWSNTSRQEKLLQEAEALAEVEDLAEVARRLKRVQADWKKLGPGSRKRSDELWKRFKATCDAAHERCAEYFEQQDRQRQDNLQKKTALCEQAEALQDSDQFKETAERLKAMQAEWKSIGPVPRKQSDAIWKRFRAACDHFFERRKEAFRAQDAQREENLQKKTELCERAEALQGSDDWDETANQLKGLQAEWKATGPVPRKQSDAIWKRFRTACDHFFERRKDYLDEGRREHLARRQELLQELTERLEQADAASAAEVAARFVEAWGAWSGLSPVPADQEGPTRKTLLELTARAVQEHRAAFLGTVLDPMLTAQKMESLCDKAEALVAETEERVGGPRGDDVDPQDAEAMAAKLKEALAASAFREEFQQEDAQRLTDELQKLEQAWSRLPPLPGPDAESLGERFQRACARTREITREAISEGR